MLQIDVDRDNDVTPISSAHDVTSYVERHHHREALDFWPDLPDLRNPWEFCRHTLS